MAAYETNSKKKGHITIVRIFAPPMAACDPAKTWKAAAKMIERRLRARYGEAIQTEFIELFSPESFTHPEIMQFVEINAANPPYVTINGQLVSSGGKLSESVIRRELERLGVTSLNNERE